MNSKTKADQGCIIKSPQILSFVYNAGSRELACVGRECETVKPVGRGVRVV